MSPAVSVTRKPPYEAVVEEYALRTENVPVDVPRGNSTVAFAAVATAAPATNPEVQ